MASRYNQGLATVQSLGGSKAGGGWRLELPPCLGEQSGPGSFPGIAFAQRVGQADRPGALLFLVPDSQFRGPYLSSCPAFVLRAAMGVELLSQSEHLLCSPLLWGRAAAREEGEAERTQVNEQVPPLQVTECSQLETRGCWSFPRVWPRRHPSLTSSSPSVSEFLFHLSPTPSPASSIP